MDTKIEKITITPNYGKFIIEPLERGYGVTLGSSMRRVLLSSIPGAAPTYVKISGVLHEFSTLPGVLEDVTEIILNIKRMAIKLNNSHSTVIYFDVNGKREVKAGDIKPNPEVEIVNPDWHIATLTEKDSHLFMEIGVSKGKGYLPSEKQKQTGEIGIVPLDSLFSPITKINYIVEDTRVGQATDYNKLILEIWTNGTISPEEAVSHAAKILIKHLNIFAELSPKFEELQEDLESSEKILSKKIDEFDFSVRCKKLFENLGIETIEDILKYSKKELLQYPNFGKLSLKEIEEKLAARKLFLKEE